jgi:hypothetical protein
MEKTEIKKLGAKIVSFIRPTPGCQMCSSKVMQMCGKCFGRIRHKLPLTEKQQTRIRDIEYEAKKILLKKRKWTNFKLFIFSIFCFFSILPMTAQDTFLGAYMPEYNSAFLMVGSLLLHILSWMLFLGVFLEIIQLFYMKRVLKYQRTIEDENYY